MMTLTTIKSEIEIPALLHAVAETSYSRRDRNALHRLADAMMASSSPGRETPVPPPLRYTVTLLEKIAAHSELVSEYLRAKELAVEGRDQISKLTRYPWLVTILGAIAFGILGLVQSWISTMVLAQTESWGPSWLQGLEAIGISSAVLQQSIPLVGVLILLGAIVIRWFGGPVAWYYMEGWIPGLGSLKRSLGSADLFRVASILARSDMTLQESFTLAGRSSEYPLNAILGEGIAKDLEQGRTLVQAIASRSWFPNWTVEFLHRMESQQPVSTSLKNVADLLDGNALSRGRVLSRAVPQLLFCALLILLQYGYLSMIAKLTQLIGWLS